jgi:hypothetical protein
MGKYDRLTEMCRKLGYHGICPEALNELISIRPMVDDFMAGMRKMFFGEEGSKAEEQDESFFLHASAAYPSSEVPSDDDIHAAANTTIARAMASDVLPTGITGQRLSIVKRYREGATMHEIAVQELIATGMTYEKADERLQAARSLLSKGKGE